MMSSLRRLAKQGVASYGEEGPSGRASWVTGCGLPSQLVIAVSQVSECRGIVLHFPNLHCLTLSTLVAHFVNLCLSRW